jgi:hypothetical protein
MAAITNVLYCTIPLARGISSDELNNVLKNAYEISQQNGNCSYWIKLEIMER